MYYVSTLLAIFRLYGSRNPGFDYSKTTARPPLPHSVQTSTKWTWISFYSLTFVRGCPSESLAASDMSETTSLKQDNPIDHGVPERRLLERQHLKRQKR
jgi:hypothetical protein